jgi:LysM repeat protein
MIERPAIPPAMPDAAAAALAACPHLASVDGPWHSATPSRAHRCRLLASGRPTLDRQREHCLTSAHVACPTWLETHGDTGPRRRPGPFVPMAPVVLEGAGLGLPSEAATRRLAAPATVVVVGLALVALLLARGPLAPGSSGAGDDGASPTPVGTGVPATAAPTGAPTAAPSTRPTERPAATSQPSATPRPRTYKVRSGDTLTGIAARFGTTVAEIADLNSIPNPSLIRVGQVLDIP